MSISITTVNIGDVFPMAAFDDFLTMGSTGMDIGGMGQVLDTSLLSAFLLPSNLLQTLPVPQLPTPVSTADFPDSGAMSLMPSRSPHTRPTTTSRCATKRKRHVPAPDCCIYLETVSSGLAATLPCEHVLHRLCLFSLMNSPVLGALSMVRCPLCRYAIDRYDLRGTCDVTVPRVIQTAKRCAGIRLLTNGYHLSPVDPPSRIVARLIQDCKDTSADDGFVYNIAILSIERAISHRLRFVQTLAMQLQAPQNQLHDPLEFISENLACHVEVLMRVANHVDNNA